MEDACIDNGRTVEQCIDSGRTVEPLSSPVMIAAVQFRKLYGSFISKYFIIFLGFDAFSSSSNEVLWLISKYFIIFLGFDASSSSIFTSYYVSFTTLLRPPSLILVSRSQISLVNIR